MLSSNSGCICLIKIIRLFYDCTLLNIHFMNENSLCQSECMILTDSNLNYFSVANAMNFKHKNNLCNLEMFFTQI